MAVGGVLLGLAQLRDANPTLDDATVSDEFAGRVLVMLGLDHDEAARIAALPLPAIPSSHSWHKLPMEVASMATRNVVLTERQEQLIASLVEAGRYQNASEVLRDGLRLLEREQREFEVRLQTLRDAAQHGWDDIDAGRYLDVTTSEERARMWDEIDNRVSARRASRASRAS